MNLLKTKMVKILESDRYHKGSEVMIRRIALDDISKLDIVITQGLTGKQVYEKYKADYILNLSLYDMNTGKNITYMEDENMKSGYLFSDRGLGITLNSKPVWCTHKEAYNSLEIKDYCSFSPILVEDGKKSISWGNKVSSYVNGNHYRSFLGFNDSHFFIGVSDYKNTIDGLADYCISQGMIYAGNNDGNGSTFFCEKGKVLRSSSRRNASWLLVYLNKEPHKGDKEMVTKGKVIINGTEKDVDLILKDGTNYVKLRDLQDSQILVGYDTNKKLATLDVKK